MKVIGYSCGDCKCAYSGCDDPVCNVRKCQACNSSNVWRNDLILGKNK